MTNKERQDISNYIHEALVKPEINIDEETMELCKKLFPLEKVPISNNISIARVNQLAESFPHLLSVTKLFNKYLPNANRRVSVYEDFSPRLLDLADGRVVDLAETWKGHSYLMFEGDNVVGAAIGRKELLVDKDKSRRYTGRGFLVLTVAESHVHGTPASVVLSGLPAISLINSDIIELHGSCALENKRNDKFYSRFAKERNVDGEFIRYVFDAEKISSFSILVQKWANVRAKDWQKLVSPDIYTP